MKRVIGLGAGGHAKVLVDLIEQLHDFEIVGFLERDPARWGHEFARYPIIGGDEQLASLRDAGVAHAFVGIGSVGDNRPRARLYHSIKDAGLEVLTLVHPTATIAKSVQLGDGVSIMAGAILQPDAVLADNVVINTASVIEHDCQLADHVFIAPSVTLSGGVIVGAFTHIGTGAVVRQGIHIGRQVIIGAGAVVVQDVPDHVVVVGNPARVLRANNLNGDHA